MTSPRRRRRLLLLLACADARPVRTYLAVPAHRRRLVQSAAASAADAVFLDLEDAVLILNRDRRMVFASGSVEKLKGAPDYGDGDMVMGDVPADAGAGQDDGSRAEPGTRADRYRGVHRPLPADGDVRVGVAVMKFTAPASASEPYCVEPLPCRNSIRSMEEKGMGRSRLWCAD